MNLDDREKILVLGMGGIGGFYGGNLLSQRNIDFFVKENKFSFLTEKEFLVQSNIDSNLNRSFIPHLVTVNTEKKELYKLVLLCVKTYDTLSILKSAQHLIHPNASIVVIQNGIDNENPVKEIMPNAQIFPVFAHIVTALHGPNLVAHLAGPGTIVFDTKYFNNPDLKLLIQDLQKSGVDVKISEKFVEERWEKFIFITAFGGVTAAFRVSIGEILNDQVKYDVFRSLISQGLDVAVRKGINFKKSEVTKRLISRVEAYRGGQEGATSSLMRDLMAGKKSTEADFLSGAMYRLGKSMDLDMSFHGLIWRLTTSLE